MLEQAASIGQVMDSVLEGARRVLDTMGPGGGAEVTAGVDQRKPFASRRLGAGC